MLSYHSFTPHVDFRNPNYQNSEFLKKIKLCLCFVCFRLSPFAETVLTEPCTSLNETYTNLTSFSFSFTSFHRISWQLVHGTLSQRCRAICTASAKSHAVPGWLEVVSVLFTPCMSFFNQFWWRGAVTRDQKEMNTKMNLTYKSIKSKLLWIYLLSMEIKKSSNMLLNLVGHRSICWHFITFM